MEDKLNGRTEFEHKEHRKLMITWKMLSLIIITKDKFKARIS